MATNNKLHEYSLKYGISYVDEHSHVQIDTIPCKRIVFPNGYMAIITEREFMPGKVKYAVDSLYNKSYYAEGTIVSTRMPEDFEFETEDGVIARCETIRKMKIEDKENLKDISQILGKNPTSILKRLQVNLK